MLDFKKIYEEFEGRIPCKKGCSVCCQREGDVVLFPGESELLIKQVPEAKEYIYKKEVNNQAIELIKQPCPFLKDNLCSIEEDRPFDCRFYPFDYCFFDNKIIVINSKSCPAVSDVSENESKKIQKNLLDILRKVPIEWLKSAILFGPCGICDKKVICEVAQAEGYNDKER